MACWYYRDYNARRFGLSIVVPDEANQELVDRVIFDDLVRGNLRPSSKASLLEVLQRLRARGAEGAILGCTEFSLLISGEASPGFPLFDTSALHVEAAMRAALPPAECRPCSAPRGAL